jgi:uncharacterized protein (TIGR00725 family)
MGTGANASEEVCQSAYALGKLIAQQGWVLLTGGRNVGVMEAASQGAKAGNGLTIGILPTDDYTGLSESVDIAIATGLGNARNVINVLSSDVVVACGMGAGTASEIALALKAKKPVILLALDDTSQQFFLALSSQQCWVAATAEAAIQQIHRLLG